ncbi:MAG: immunity protein 32 [Rhizobium sp.]|nr:immunity protein 32 [Rhizobium sp.]MBW8319778.1 immunity protein 32 [Rhizobium sp.]MBW8445555.1 immunity protein 32 [Arenimonas sp.]
MILTVEREQSDEGEVAICFDQEGLELLISKLSKLRGGPDHLHLMTPAWAGSELTEERQGGGGYELCNSLRLVRIA